MASKTVTALALHESEDLPTMLSFLSIAEIGRACSISDWTVGEEISILTAIAKGAMPGVKPRDRIQAADRLRQIIGTGLRMAGYVQEVSRQGVLQAGDADRTVRVLETHKTARLLASSADRALAVLETGDVLHGRPGDQDEQGTRGTLPGELQSDP